MKTKHLLILIPLFLGSCYPTAYYSLKLNDHPNTYISNGKSYAYSDLDSVIVSIAFYESNKNEYSFDLAIDNLTDSTIVFDPADIYVFRYTNDSVLASNTIYKTINPRSVIDSLDKKILAKEKKIRRNGGLSLFFGLAMLTTEIATIGSDNAEAKQDLRESHSDLQNSLEYSCYSATDEIDRMEYQKVYWQSDVFNKTQVKSGEIKSKKIHINIPRSEQFRMYIPVNDRIYRFAFSSVKHDY